MGRRKVLSGPVCTGPACPKLVVWHWQYMGDLLRQVHFNYHLLGVRARDNRPFRSANGHMVKMPYHHRQRLAWRQARHSSTGDQRRHPRERLAGDVTQLQKRGQRCGLLGRSKTREVLQRPGHGCEGGSSLVWLAQRPPASCRRKQEKQKKKTDRRGSRGALLRREPLSIDQQQHSTAGAGRVNPSKAVEAERAEEKPEDRAGHGMAWHGIA